jgi:hypothetical protein
MAIVMGKLRQLSKKYGLSLIEWKEWERYKHLYFASMPIYFICQTCHKKVMVEPFIAYLISLERIRKIDVCQNCNKRGGNEE